ncbi:MULTISPECIES: hypothetical protein [Halomonadaceae]|uniref:Phage integrase family protein n=1 Tax=Modicisalibacter xianhensis TaxID=442341 RepID=A0A1I3EN70_9GAMM|nr:MULTISPECIES: hypothetical protein [Halomonas]SFI00338.1 hypothetical protein SAMN04487959_11464 [Halomonas xianhensis]
MKKSLDRAQLISFLDAPDFSETPIADWLLSDWHAPVWYIKRGFGKEERVPGTDRWRRANRINWDVRLLKGRTLLDPEMADLLETIRRLVWLSRSGPSMFTSNARVQLKLAHGAIALIRWMILRGLSEPLTMLRFGALTVKHFEWFLEDVQRGLEGLLGVSENIQAYLADLEDNEDYSSILNADGLVSYQKLADATDLPMVHLAKSPAVRAILEESGLSMPRRNDRSAYTTELVDLRIANGWGDDVEPTVGKHTIYSLLLPWRELFTQRPYLPDGIGFDAFGIESSPSLYAEQLGRGTNRTPTIPYPIALHYLNHAIKWVVEYGHELVGYYFDLVDATGGQRLSKYSGTAAFGKVRQPVALDSLNIVRAHRYHTGVKHRTRRESPSIFDAIDCLIGACFLVLGAFSARRVEELVALRGDGLVGEPGCYRLRFYLEKGSDYGPMQEVLRPIPDVGAQAFGLIASLSGTASTSGFIFRFGDALRDIEGRHLIINRMAQFADMIEVPAQTVNDVLARWYVQPHELRRFFAMAFFWHRRDASLDALSWFMGHLNKEQTLRYIQESMGGAELFEEEARFTMEALRRHIANVENREKLEADVERHFNVNRLEVIPDEDLQDYLEYLHESGALNIEVVASPDVKSAGEALIIRYQREVA